MEKHDLDEMNWLNLLLWLQKHGMDISGERLPVEYRYFSEHGRGLAVNRDVQSNETLFTIPTSCLMNLDTLSDWAKSHSATSLSATQLLASYLGLYKGSSSNIRAISFKPYLDTLPDFDFHPLTWMTMETQKKTEKLPPGVRYKVTKVQERFLQDLKAIRTKFPLMSKADCLWGWLNVNTRSLYYKCKRAKDHADNITLCPLLDFSNHSFTAPNFNTQFHRRNGHPIPTMIASPDGLHRGEEIFLLYGNHSNEVFFSEYGFTDPNAPKELCIDEAVEELFRDSEEGQAKMVLLQARGYWGDWTLHTDPAPAHPSYRLIPALRLLHLSLTDQMLVSKWEETVSGSLDEVSVHNTHQVRETLSTLCTKYYAQAKTWLSLHSSPDKRVGHGDLEVWPSIRLLWEQQRDVSSLVQESILSGIEL